MTRLNMKSKNEFILIDFDWRLRDFIRWIGEEMNDGQVINVPSSTILTFYEDDLIRFYYEGLVTYGWQTTGVSPDDFFHYVMCNVWGAYDFYDDSPDLDIVSLFYSYYDNAPFGIHHFHEIHDRIGLSNDEYLKVHDSNLRSSYALCTIETHRK